MSSIFSIKRFASGFGIAKRAFTAFSVKTTLYNTRRGVTLLFQRTACHPTENQAAAKHRLLELDIEIIGDILPDAKASDYGFRVYWGIMPQGGASVEAATGPKRELMKAPSGGEELPFSRFTRRKREVFDFVESDRGKTVSFCIRLENAKGQAGPWGTVFSMIIL